MYVCLQHSLPERDADSLYLSFLLTLVWGQWLANHMWKPSHFLPYKGGPGQMRTLRHEGASCFHTISCLPVFQLQGKSIAIFSDWQSNTLMSWRQILNFKDRQACLQEWHFLNNIITLSVPTKHSLVVIKCQVTSQILTPLLSIILKL